MRYTGPVELLLMYDELMDPCVYIMVKWQHRDLIHLTAAQLLMTSRLLNSSISLDDVTTAEIFNKLG
ncbi:hypothetical protein F511_31255 [Dorcoceras hygrometricum]|uniref:Uncharacterized protein n=1 Tax=Dorcoceras hygrometricum TaxID=472368 RepID=A0A2Z7AGG4_9LAMI|nr:hypothetical protein F511_31255 [Dorcoceras hygrometricum]